MSCLIISWRRQKTWENLQMSTDGQRRGVLTLFNWFPSQCWKYNSWFWKMAGRCPVRAAYGGPVLRFARQQVVFYGAKTFSLYDELDSSQPLPCGLNLFCLFVGEAKPGVFSTTLPTTWQYFDSYSVIPHTFFFCQLIVSTHLSIYCTYVSCTQLKLKSVFPVEYVPKCCRDTKLRSLPAACGSEDAKPEEAWANRRSLK